jgi:hypothetical protein
MLHWHNIFFIVLHTSRMKGGLYLIKNDFFHRNYLIHARKHLLKMTTEYLNRYDIFCFCRRFFFTESKIPHETSSWIFHNRNLHPVVHNCSVKLDIILDSSRLGPSPCRARYHDSFDHGNDKWKRPGRFTTR